MIFKRLVVYCLFINSGAKILLLIFGRRIFGNNYEGLYELGCEIRLKE
jgi:hypothetical protein